VTALENQLVYYAALRKAGACGDAFVMRTAVMPSRAAQSFGDGMASVGRDEARTIAMISE
jgi:hypothetical protein